jgi:radical SAM protein with 4Fe4S-binding SPASM domain
LDIFPEKEYGTKTGVFMQYSLSNDFLNPAKILFHISNILQKGNFTNIAVNPVAVEIHPTSKCNHQCIHCSYQERNENRLSLDENVMDRLINSIIDMKIKSVYFSGGGEPSMYPGIVKHIKKLYDSGVEVALLTNGSILVETGIASIAHMFNYIAVSVPSVNKESFKYITGSERVNAVLDCADLIKHMHKEKSPVIGARVVLTSIIYKEIRTILETLLDKKYDYVLFKIVRDYEDRGLGLNEKETEELREIVACMKPLNSDFTNLNTIFDYKNFIFMNDKCIINEMGLIANINSDGKVYPNIVEIGQENFCIGNLYHETLDVMWHGEAHGRVKAASHAKWGKRECKNCRALAYNQIIYDILKKMPRSVDNFI